MWRVAWMRGQGGRNTNTIFLDKENGSNRLCNWCGRWLSPSTHLQAAHARQSKHCGSFWLKIKTKKLCQAGGHGRHSDHLKETKRFNGNGSKGRKKKREHKKSAGTVALIEWNQKRKWTERVARSQEDDEKKKRNNTTAIGIFGCLSFCFASLELWPFSIAGVSRDFCLFPKEN